MNKTIGRMIEIKSKSDILNEKYQTYLKYKNDDMLKDCNGLFGELIEIIKEDFFYLGRNAQNLNVFEDYYYKFFIVDTFHMIRGILEECDIVKNDNTSLRIKLLNELNEIFFRELDNINFHLTQKYRISIEAK